MWKSQRGLHAAAAKIHLQNHVLLIASGFTAATQRTPVHIVNMADIQWQEKTCDPT